MPTKRKTEYHKMLKWLRENHKPHHKKVKVTRKRLAKGYLGYSYVTRLKDSGLTYIILIDSKQPAWVQRETLLHEWAHVLQGPKKPGEDDHSSRFWIIYGNLYRDWDRKNISSITEG